MGGGEGCFSIGGALFLSGWAPLGGIGFDGEVSKKIIRQEGGTPMPSLPPPPLYYGKPCLLHIHLLPRPQQEVNTEGRLKL